MRPALTPRHAERVVLPWVGRYAVEPLLRSLAAHAVPGLESTDLVAGTHTRVVRAPGGPAVVTVGFPRARDAGAPQGERSRVEGAVTLTLDLAAPGDLAVVQRVVRRWLALDVDTGPAETHLAAHDRLRPLVRERPGLRVTGCVDGFEQAVLTVLGQQVSLAAARTFAGRLVAALGDPAPQGRTAFPCAQRLAALEVETLRATVGLTRSRARTVVGLAVACAEGLDLGPDADPVEAAAGLGAVAGVGPWTVDYLRLRALGDVDAFPAGDLVLRRALGAGTTAEVEHLSQAWRPWRAFAALHLWHGNAYGAV
ncbi:DNA-3-methyladenine glycosylase [Actinotalea sp. K2]|uniref:DNA-3-methyladenine glycosylase family protein n=1 Tax=Actinotalea sp. K2 TaxID=2939438 RepID=UPI002017EC2E|nr:AlkA N-terminal domain-containing protein [Actinotalea sp. K2]MCL3862892.1 3-methyladenine DNA glycosylase 2 [Actinotalea sp. K2]